MEQQIITDKNVELGVQAEGNPLVVISEPITSEVISLDSEASVKVITEESAVLLVLTEGGSLYKHAVNNGYSGTELEWLTELLDSKASVQFVVTTMADGYNAYASALLALKAEVGDTYATNIHLSEVIAQQDLARALDKQVLEAKIENDIQASYTSVIDVIVTRDLAISQKQTELTAELSTFNAKVNSVEQAIATETSARTLAINSMSSSLNGRIDAEITTINQTVVDQTSSLAQQINNLDSSFNGLLTSNINTVNTAITTESTARAQQINVLRTDFTSGLSAVLTTVQEVQIDIAGNTQAIDSITATVNNPTTGLSAAFARANQAYTLANGTAGTVSTIQGQVNNPTTGLAATYSFAQQVQINATNNTATAINNLRNEITAPSAGWIANNTFIQSIESDANNAYTIATSLSNTLEDSVNDAIANNTLIQEITGDIDGIEQAQTTLSSSISALENWKTNTATVQLTTLINDVGELESKAFLGVSSTVGGKATIAGVTVNSVDYSLRFQGNVFELTNTSGVQQLYYDSAVGQWKFSGELVAATFKTATSGYRAEMGGVSGYPFWFGTGTKNDSNGLFYVNTFGHVVMKSATLQGGLVTIYGSGARGEYTDDGTYLIWLGTGVKNDVNGTFWVKKNGDGYIKGTFFQGQLIRRRFNSAALYSVTASGHITAGQPVRIDCTGYFRYSFTSPTEPASNAGLMNWVIKRNGVTIASGSRQMSRIKRDPGGESGVNWQNIDYVQMNIMFFDNTPGSFGTNNSYTFEMTDLGYGTYSTTVATDENLVG